MLLTGEAGGFGWLSPDDFQAFLAGELPADHPALEELRAQGLLRSPGVEAELMARLRRRSAHLFRGPSLHIVILTLRCDQACVYCHASRKPASSRGFDMSEQCAERILDVIFSSPSPDLTIEFQGGEPLLNFDILRYVVEQAYRRNDAGEPRRLYFSLVSNLASVTDEQIAFLVDHGVMVCTSIDGPQALHDRNRPFAKRSSGSTHLAALRGIEAFDQAYRDRGLDSSLAFVNALVTVSRGALSQPCAIVDEYVRLGHKVIHLRPLNPFGMGRKIWSRRGYSAEQFLEFYIQALDYILDLNSRGVEIMEKMASIMLTRILTDDDPNYMDLRSPCGAGIGQLAYDHDGRVYTCDEGRMVSAMGDEMFCVGDVTHDGYAEIIRHPTLRSLCVASCAECLPGCADCAYVPYCGVCPVYNYMTEGDLIARCPTNDRCRIQKGILDAIFARLRNPSLRSLLERWTVMRDRSSVFRRRTV